MLNKIVNQVVINNPQYKSNILVIEKEILHHDILSVMKKHQILQNLTFIGGTALRLCYSSVRLSEDLDFSVNKGVTLQSLTGFGDEIAKAISSKYGTHVTVKEPVLDKGDTSTWKVSIEKEANRPDIPKQKIHIDLCKIPSLENEHRPLIDHYNIHHSAYLIPVQSQKEILADKFIALALRNNIKSRDLWDIVWLQQKNITVNPKAVKDKLLLRNIAPQHFQTLMANKLLKLTTNPQIYKNFTNEMSRFLPDSIVSETINNDNFWHYLKNEIKIQANMVVDNIINDDQAKPNFNMGL